MDTLSIRLEAEAPEIFAGIAHLGDGSRSILMIKGSSTRSARSLVRELGVENVEIRSGFELTRQELLDLASDAADVVRQIDQVDAFTVSTSLQEQRLAISIASKDVEPNDVEAMRSLTDHVDAQLVRKSAPLGGRIDISVEDLSKFDDGLESLYGGDKMVSGGGSQAVCTTAFGVKRGTTRGMLMAAHCSWGGPSAPRHYVHEWGTTHWNGQLTVEDVHGGYFGDLMWMTSTGWESPRFYAKKNTRRTATGYRSYNQIDPGDYVCGFGRRTNSTTINCTTVAEVGFWKNQYGNMVRTWGQFLIEGDSGGPWYFWKTAIGTHHGNATTGTCPNCDTFSVVANALALWNLELLTS